MKRGGVRAGPPGAPERRPGRRRRGRSRRRSRRRAAGGSPTGAPAPGQSSPPVLYRGARGTRGGKGRGCVGPGVRCGGGHVGENGGVRPSGGAARLEDPDAGLEHAALLLGGELLLVVDEEEVLHVLVDRGGELREVEDGQVVGRELREGHRGRRRTGGLVEGGGAFGDTTAGWEGGRARLGVGGLRDHPPDGLRDLRPLVAHRPGAELPRRLGRVVVLGVPLGHLVDERGDEGGVLLERGDPGGSVGPGGGAGRRREARVRRGWPARRDGSRRASLPVWSWRRAQRCSQPR